MKNIILCSLVLIFACSITATVSTIAFSKTAKHIILDYHYTEDQMKQIKNYTKEDILWLARNIFFEARSEGIHGRMVVAFVTINRVLRRQWPGTIKEVVTQPWQFSWYNEKIVPAIDPEEMDVFDECIDLAGMCLDLYNDMATAEGFEYDGITKGASHYFADWIKAPWWAAKMDYLGKVGVHLLYREA